MNCILMDFMVLNPLAETKNSLTGGIVDKIFERVKIPAE